MSWGHDGDLPWKGLRQRSSAVKNGVGVWIGASVRRKLELKLG